MITPLPGARVSYHDRRASPAGTIRYGVVVSPVDYLRQVDVRFEDNDRVESVVAGRLAIIEQGHAEQAGAR